MRATSKRRFLLGSDPIASVMTPISRAATDDLSVNEIRSLLATRYPAAMPVIDADGTVIGTISLRDLLAATQDMRVRDLMTPVSRVVHEYMTLRTVARTMLVHNVAHMPVVDRAGHLVGIVSADLLFCLADPRASDDDEACA